MALFVAIVIGDLAQIFLFYTSERFGMTTGGWSADFCDLLFVTPPSMRFIHLFLINLVSSCLRHLFGLGSFTLALRGCVSLLNFLGCLSWFFFISLKDILFWG